MPSPRMWPNILLLGDSLSQRGFSPEGKWVSKLANHLSGKCDVINRGFSGYNTRMLAHFLPTSDIVHPDMVKRNMATLVFLGANDSVEPDQGQHVPVDEYMANLVQILEFLKEAGIPKENLMLVPPPPCDEDAWKKFIEERDGTQLQKPTKTKAMTKKYHDACVKTAADHGYRHLTGVWEKMEKDCSAMFCDGLHFSEAGSEVFANLMIHQLEQSFRIANVPFVLPYWRNLFDKDGRLQVE